MRLLFSITKLPVGMANALAALLGYLLYRNDLSGPSLLTFFSVLILASGAAVLNNYQDKEWDKHLDRTRHRPLPSGKVSPKAALLLVLFLVIIGLLGLFAVNRTLLLPALGMLAAILYNGIYTPLKRKTLLAIFPGMLCGMIPPIIGWLAAGGPWWDHRIWFVMLVFALWQLPHFWLILLNHHRDYEKTQIPSMLCLFSRTQLHWILFPWVMIFAMGTLCFPLLGIVYTNPVRLLFLLNALILIAAFAVRIFWQKDWQSYRGAFLHITASMMLVMLLAIGERLST